MQKFFRAARGVGAFFSFFSKYWRILLGSILMHTRSRTTKSGMSIHFINKIPSIDQIFERITKIGRKHRS